MPLSLHRSGSSSLRLSRRVLALALALVVAVAMVVASRTTSFATQTPCLRLLRQPYRVVVAAPTSTAIVTLPTAMAKVGVATVARRQPRLSL